MCICFLRIQVTGDFFPDLLRYYFYFSRCPVYYWYYGAFLDLLYLDNMKNLCIRKEVEIPDSTYGLNSILAFWLNCRKSSMRCLKCVFVFMTSAS